MADDLKEVLQNIIRDIWNEPDLNKVMDAADTYVHEDVIDHHPVAESRGIDGTKRLFTMYHTAFPDMQFEAEDLVEEGDRVALRWRARGTNTGEFMGMPPTGRPVDVTGIDIYRIVDGKVKEHWPQLDMITLLRQLGVMPAPNQSGRPA